MSEATETRDSVDRIVDAAIACIALRGYEGASTKEIARSAGVSKSLLHYHFESKEHLLIRAAARLFEGIAQEIRDRARARGPSLASIAVAADDLYDLLISNRERVAFLTEMWATGFHNDRLRTLLAAQREHDVRMIQDTIVETLGPDAEALAVPPVRLARLVCTSIAGLAVESNLQGRGGGGVRQVFEDLKEVVLRGTLRVSTEAPATSQVSKTKEPIGSRSSGVRDVPSRA